MVLQLKRQLLVWRPVRRFGVQSGRFKRRLTCRTDLPQSNFTNSPAVASKSAYVNFGKRGAGSRPCSRRGKGRQPLGRVKRLLPSPVASRCPSLNGRRLANGCGNIGRRGGRRRDGRSLDPFHVNVECYAGYRGEQTPR